MTAIKDQIQRGDYHVDTQAVADAILRRLLSGIPVIPGAGRGQNECSYPSNSPS